MIHKSLSANYFQRTKLKEETTYILSRRWEMVDEDDDDVFELFTKWSIFCKKNVFQFLRNGGIISSHAALSQAFITYISVI